jgi:RimJ/RimL family protein N-acetyltransferase
MSQIMNKANMNGNIKLRQMHMNDLELFCKWLYKPHVARWFHHPQEWIEEIELQDSRFSWVHHFIVEYEGKPMGFCQYYACCYSDEIWEGQEIIGSYSIDYLIGETEFLHYGFGKQIVAALIEQIMNNKDACRILVQPEPENAASCSLLSSCGFTLHMSAGIYVKQLTSHA